MMGFTFPIPTIPKPAEDVGDCVSNRLTFLKMHSARKCEKFTNYPLSNPRASSSRRCLNSSRGLHPPEAMMHFPTVSDFALISETIFRLRGKFSQFYLFPKKFLIFTPKISDDLF